MRHAALVSETVTVHAWYDRDSDVFCGQITDDADSVVEETSDDLVTSYRHSITHDEVIRTYGPSDGFTDTVNLIEAIREDLYALDLNFLADAAQEMAERLDNDTLSAADTEAAPHDRVLAAAH